MLFPRRTFSCLSWSTRRKNRRQRLSSPRYGMHSNFNSSLSYADNSVYFQADPQLLDMHSYPERLWIARKLGVWFTDNYLRKAWRFVIKSKGAGGGVDAVIWLGDLLDSGVESVDRKELSFMLLHTEPTLIFYKQTFTLCSSIQHAVSTPTGPVLVAIISNTSDSVDPDPWEPRSRASSFFCFTRHIPPRTVSSQFWGAERRENLWGLEYSLG